ncbi:MAG: hypothetical protein A3F72_04260 [Bacteroidetes bacterium RIFCSPLOWO2_12_FULL_35_15]|nr:MAG: hypothetical protein A3F72_04260 [Bacteroidetes bacterium RIFCSPLOWO2_12_FULL_35_15]
MTNKEKFLALVAKETPNSLEKNKVRIKNRAMLRESQQIAIKVLKKLDDLGWSQKDLAKEMDVAPQQVTKIVSGKENLTIETQLKLQNILDIPVLASYYENKGNESGQWVLIIDKKVERFATATNLVMGGYKSETISKKVERQFYKKESYQMAG